MNLSYVPWKRQKARFFLTFSGSIKREGTLAWNGFTKFFDKALFLDSW